MSLSTPLMQLKVLTVVSFHFYFPINKYRWRSQVDKTVEGFYAVYFIISMDLNNFYNTLRLIKGLLNKNS